MLESLVEASHEFIGIADLEGNALFVNEAGRELVGLRDLDAVRSTRIIDYFAANDQSQGSARCHACCSQHRLLAGRAEISEFRDRRAGTGAVQHLPGSRLIRNNRWPMEP